MVVTLLAATLVFHTFNALTYCKKQQAPTCCISNGVLRQYFVLCAGTLRCSSFDVPPMCWIALGILFALSSLINKHYCDALAKANASSDVGFRLCSRTSMYAAKGAYRQFSFQRLKSLRYVICLCTLPWHSDSTRPGIQKMQAGHPPSLVWQTGKRGWKGHKWSPSLRGLTWSGHQSGYLGNPTGLWRNTQPISCLRFALRRSLYTANDICTSLM